MLMEWTTEGCRVVIARHGRNCWRLQPMCRRHGVWRFVSPRLLHFCCITHFSYCKRKDPTRNLVVDGAYCISNYPVCCDAREKCEEYFIKWIDYVQQQACEKAEYECLLKCFGLHAEEHGKFIALDNYEYCCYHRCDDRWRCAKYNCSFERAPKPLETYGEE